MEDTAGGRDTDRRGRIDLRRVAAAGGAAAHQVLPVNLRLWGGSALTSDEYAVPENREGRAGEIPITYVPARNLIFLALATGYAEALGRAIFSSASIRSITPAIPTAVRRLSGPLPKRRGSAPGRSMKTGILRSTRPCRTGARRRSSGAALPLGSITV